MTVFGPPGRTNPASGPLTRLTRRTRNQADGTEWGVKEAGRNQRDGGQRDAKVWFRCAHGASRIGVIERLSLLANLNGACYFLY